MNLSRRGFLSGIIAACAAPAIIRTTGLIMPIKPVLIPQRTGIVVNSWMTYAAIGMRDAIREDLQDIIYEISPQESPFAMFALRNEPTLHEWMTDQLVEL